MLEDGWDGWRMGYRFGVKCPFNPLLSLSRPPEAKTVRFVDFVVGKIDVVRYYVRVDQVIHRFVGEEWWTELEGEVLVPAAADWYWRRSDAPNPPLW